MEDRFDELFDAHRARDVPVELVELWRRVYRLASAAPVRHPFRFGTLEIQVVQPHMRIDKGDRYVADVEWMDLSRRPVLPPQLIHPTGAVGVVKE